MLNVRGLGFEQQSTSSFGMPIPTVYERIAEQQRWEYHSVAIDLREDEPLDEVALNALGADGWMLMSVTQPASRGDAARLIYYFMRPALG